MAIPHLSQVSISTPAGTPPLVVTSSDLVSNLNAQYLNGQLGSYYAAASSLASYLPLAGGTLTGELVVNYAAGRQRIIDGANALILGHWDTVNVRIEASGRPMYIVSYNGAISIGRSSGSNLVVDTASVSYGGNTVLHAGNYTSYPDATKLPLTGGTLTGGLSGTTGYFSSDVTWIGYNSGNPRSARLGYSGGNYGSVSYGINYTATTASHTYAFNDAVTRIDLADGIQVYSAAAAVAGTAVSWTTLLEATRGNGNLRWKGNTVLDSNNYNSFALPLGGGTMTGSIILPAAGYVGLSGGSTFGIGVLATNRNSGVFDTLESTGSDPLELNYYQGGPVKIGSGTYGSKSLYAVGIYDNGNAVLTSASTSAPSLSVGGSSARWATGRTISLTGDVTGTSVAFDGTAALSFAATLANSGATAGTYTKVTVNAKGLVTAGAALASADLPTYTGTITSGQVTTGLGFTPYNASNPNNYITSSGSITGNAATVGNVSKVQLFNNTGLTHGAYTTFAALPEFGFYFMQGQNVADAPPAQAANQYYVVSMGLGDNYSYSQYAKQIALPRIAIGGGNNYLWIRERENTAWGSWGKVYAGYADSAGTATDATKLPLAGGTMTGNLALNTGVIFNRGSAPSITNIQCSIFNELNGISNAESLNSRAYGGFKWQYWDGSVTWMQLTSAGLSIIGTLNATGTVTASGIMYANGGLLGTAGTFSGPLIVNNDNGVRASYDNGGSYAWLYGYGIEFGRATSYIRPNTNRVANLWVGNASINSQDWANIDFYSSGRFNVNNNAILHAGNVATYALPIYGLPSGSDQYVNFRVIRNTNAAGPDGMFIGYGNANSGRTRIYGDGSTSGYFYPDASGNIFRSDGATYLHSSNYTSYPDATKLPLTGGALTGTVSISTTSSGAANRTVVIKNSGQSIYDFGSYAGAWRSALQIQSNSNDRLLFFAPPETGYEYGIIRAANGGLNIDVGGTLTTTGTTGIRIEASGAVSMPGTLNVVGAVTQNGNQVLHAGNFSSYALPVGGTAANATNSAQLGGNASANFVQGEGSRGRSTGRTSGTANSLTDPSGFYFGSGVTGMPSGDWFNWINCIGNGWGAPDGYGYQLAYSFWSDDIRMRRLESGTWRSWVSLIHSGNIGSQTVATASNATQFGGEGNTNFMRGLPSGTEANLNTYTDNGFRSITYTGYSRNLLTFNPGGSTGTVQHEYFYNIPSSGWRVRNKTDNTTWSAWGNVVMTDTNQGALTGTVITTNSNTTVSGLNIGGNAASASSLAANTNTIFKVIRFTGEGYDSGNGAYPTNYGIYQEGGSWTYPYPDLCIGFHTGIKIGAQTGYGGIRFYNTETWGTEIFSVGNGDNNVRVVNTLYVGGNVALHAGNVATYALPIGGGTITGNRPLTIDSGGGGIYIKGDTGGWATGYYFNGSSGTYKGGFGALGGGDALTNFWVGPAYNNTLMTFSSSANNSQVALQQGGNQVLHAGNFSAYALPYTGGTLTGALNGTTASFSTKVLSSRFHDSGDAFLFRSGSGAGTTRHINLADSGGDPSQVGSATGITCGERSDNAAYYMIYVKAPYNNGYSTLSRLVLGWHTGMEIGANASYGGVRFMNDSPGVSTSEIFSVGKGDSNVRVTNTIFAGAFSGPLTGNVTGSSGSCTGNAASASSVAWTNVSGRPTAVSSFSNDSGYITSGSSISGSSGSCTGNAASVTDGVYLSTNQSIGGVKTFSSAPIATNIAKAWVHYNKSTTTITASYNVSSVTSNGTGVFTVNFTNAMVDTNYVVTGTATYGYDDQDIYGMALIVPRRSTAQQAGSCRLATEFLHAAQVYDCVAVRAVFYR